MSAIPLALTQLRDRLASSLGPETVTPRELLRWFNSSRRNAWTNRHIREALKDLKLRMDPDFETANIDETLVVRIEQLMILPAISQPTNINSTEFNPSAVDVITGPEKNSESLSEPKSGDEPTLRVRILPAAIRAPFTLEPTASIQQATTVMLSKNFSQIPIVRHRAVIGVLSWKSLGCQIALGDAPVNVGSCTEVPLEIRSETLLLDAIVQMMDHDYALIKDDKGQLCGIVTHADISAEFKALSEPFLLLREIENYIRLLISDKLGLQEIRSFRDPASTRVVNAVDDLTFGEYIYGLQRKENWGKLELKLDHKMFISYLESARKVRNDVMHFDPDPIEQDRILRLKEFARLLQQLSACNSSKVVTA